MVGAVERAVTHRPGELKARRCPLDRSGLQTPSLSPASYDARDAEKVGSGRVKPAADRLEDHPGVGRERSSVRPSRPVAARRPPFRRGSGARACERSARRGGPPAISAFERPPATRASTSCSRGVRMSRPLGAVRPANPSERSSAAASSAPRAAPSRSNVESACCASSTASSTRAVAKIRASRCRVSLVSNGMPSCTKSSSAVSRRARASSSRARERRRLRRARRARARCRDGARPPAGAGSWRPRRPGPYLPKTLQQFRLTDGGYRLENTVHCLIAIA